MAAIKKKRRGKFFVTEHYLDEETRQACNDVLVKAFVYYSQMDNHWVCSLFDDEVSFWADPSNIELFHGHSAALSEKVRWDELGVADEEFVGVMSGLREVYEMYGTSSNDTYQTFKVIFNGEQVEEIRNMVNL